MSGFADPSSGTILLILAIWRKYYNNLFSTEPCDPAMQDELLSKLERTLSDEESSSCEGLLTLEECGLDLRGMASGKTLGSDGFPRSDLLIMLMSTVVYPSHNAVDLYYLRMTVSKPKIGGQLVC